MSTVSYLSAICQQPRGGYLNPAQFDEMILNDGIQLYDNENIHGSTIGLAVEYLTKLMIGIPANKAFDISLRGANHAKDLGISNAPDKANQMLSCITGLDDISIINACTLVTYDIWYREPTVAKDKDPAIPDSNTISNIRTMVNRGIRFFEQYGPVTKIDFQFGPTDDPDDEDTFSKMCAFHAKKHYGGYTKEATAGEGDFLTNDTMWDFKVLRRKISNKHTLQILLYWIMGQHSGQKIYKSITKIGFFNPRSNSVRTVEISKIPKDIIKTIEKEILKY